MKKNHSTIRHGTFRRVVIPAAMAVAALVGATSLQAQYTEININPQANADVQTYPNGSNFQFGGTTLTVAGVPFGLAELGNNPNSTGIVQSPNGSAISAGPGGGGGLFDFTFSVPAGTHAQALYCLANSIWGTAGEDVGSIVVTGTLGETATLNLVEGTNIRDVNNDGWENSVSDPTVVSTYFNNRIANPTNAQVRLDRQELVLPSTFSGDTIASISFQGDAPGFGNGDAFLAGLTVGPVPEPTPLVLSGLGAVVFAICRRRK